MNLEIKKLSKSYGKNRVLDDFSATFAEGKTTCILGESGQGKTTLLRILMGLEEGDSGRIEGFDSAKKSAVFQEERLCQNLSAIANVKLVCSSAVTKDVIRENLLSVGLGDQSLLQPVHELSGGMQRRVALVRALMAEYDILFLDEPFKGLDTETRDVVIDFVKKMTKGKTIIMITHSEEEVKFMDGVELRLS